MIQPLTEYNGLTHKHLECICDFAGNDRDAPHWADIYQTIKGRVIKIGGNWLHYGAEPPRFIYEPDPLYEGFVLACNEGTELGFARKHWPKRK